MRSATEARRKVVLASRSPSEVNAADLLALKSPEWKDSDVDVKLRSDFEIENSSLLLVLEDSRGILKC